MSRFLSLGLLSLMGSNSAAASEELAPAIDGHTREHPLLFNDGGLPTIAEYRNHPDRAGEIAVHRRSGDDWSVGTELAMQTGNMILLQDAGNIGGNPALIFLYDRTSYPALLGLDTSQAVDAPYPGDQTELLGWMDQARQVHVSLHIQGRWTSPIGIPGTRGAKRAVLVEGEESALVLVVKDGDGEWSTTADEELFATVWSEGRWSEPMQLTIGAAQELGMSGAWTESGFVVAWGCDEDADLDTVEDRRIRSARIGAAGELLDAASDVSGLFAAPLPPDPVVVRREGAAHILWVNGGVHAEAPARLMQSALDGGWNTQEVGELAPYHATELRALPSPLGGDLLVVREGSRFRVALLDESGWHLSAPVVDLAPEGFTVREWDALVVDGMLHVAMTGAVLPGGGLSSATAEALWHTSAPLGRDVEVAQLRPVRKGVTRLEPFDAEIVVRNNGALPAENVTLLLLGMMADTQLRSLGTLAPGEERRLSVTVALADGAGRWGVRASHAGEDLHPENDLLSLASPARPDFHVASVDVHGQTVRVDVRETSGVASGQVPVEVLLQTEAGSELLGTLTFDARDPRLLELDASSLLGLEPPYRVLARVNSARLTEEADYSNNTATHQELGVADFRVVDAYVEGSMGTVEIETLAGTAPGQLGVRVFASPTEAASALKSGWTGEAVTFVSLDDQGRGRAQVELPEGGESYFYAVVNPGHIVQEARRDNNTMRFTSVRRARAQSDLALDGRDDTCGVMRVRVHNKGVAPALGSVLTLRDERGLPVQEHTLPVVAAGGGAVVEFPGLADGRYTATLLRLDRTTDQEQVTELEAFIVHETLDWDQDGFLRPECGGNDCDDWRDEVFPGSADFDDQCVEKVKVGCQGCSAQAGSPSWLAGLLGLLGAAFMRSRR